MKPFIKNLTIAAALFTLALAAGCKKTPVNPFPESGAVEGWQKSTDTRVFKADDLWQYIDGDSDHYVQAGVVTTSTSDYKFQDSIDATVKKVEAIQGRLDEVRPPFGDVSITNGAVGTQAPHTEGSLRAITPK